MVASCFHTGYFLLRTLRPLADSALKSEGDQSLEDFDKYVEKMDDRLKIDERIAKEEGIISENETLKTDIKTIAKDNKKLEKQI